MNDNNKEGIEIQDGMVEEWDEQTLEPIIDLSLELSLPLNDIHTPLPSSTIYSSASDASLIKGQQGIGGWRMFVPDIGEALGDLDIQDMMEDHMMVNTLLLENNPVDAQLQNRDMQQHDHSMEEETIDRHTKKKSAYKQEALIELQIEEGKTMEMENEKVDNVEEPKQLHNEDDEANKSKAIVEGGNAKVGEEIERIMMKVDTAMEGLDAIKSCKKMKKTIETNSEEVRRLATMLQETEDLEAIMLKEDGAVLLISSESSGESVQRKRKRRERAKSKLGAVASRLLKKDKQEGGKKEDEEAH